MDVRRFKERARFREPIFRQSRQIRQRSITARAVALPTETAVTLFAIASGVGGAISQLLASNKLATTSQETIPIRQLAVPVGLSALGAIVGAALLPGEFDIPSPNVPKPSRS